MTTEHVLTMHIEVFDAQALHDAAMKSGPDSLGVADMESLIGPRNEPNVSACLQMILDPGTSPDGSNIHESYCH